MKLKDRKIFLVREMTVSFGMRLWISVALVALTESLRLCLVQNMSRSRRMGVLRPRRKTD